LIPFDDELRERLTANLADHPLELVPVGAEARAAVAVVVVDGGDGLGASFLICRRAAKMNRHARQWALPGGKLDPGETVEDAALRELDEELGVDLPADAVIGRLDDYPTRSGFVISPVVIWGGGRVELHPDPGEVARVFTVPLDQLQVDDSPRFITIPQSDRPVVQVPLLGHLIHAPTGAVLVQFRWVALEGRSGERVAHFEQPVFAWR
jgi:8-oxo-dGTP pyrophosphatase MutT (NUDIX family)